MLLQFQHTIRRSTTTTVKLSRSVLEHRPVSFNTFNSSPSPPLSRMFALTPYKQGQTKTLDRQRELPRLPIPPLDKSLERYITSLKPLILERALQAGQGEDAVEAELNKRREWAADFQSKRGLGRLLQERLKGQSIDSA